MTSIDIIFLILFITVISVIIGLNIISVIDKKISNVSINIPDQKIVLNIEKDCKTGKLKISEPNSKNNVIFDINKDIKEEFIVDDIQHIKDTDKYLNQTLAVPDKFENNSTNNEPKKEKEKEYAYAYAYAEAKAKAKVKEKEEKGEKGEGEYAKAIEEEEEGEYAKAKAIEKDGSENCPMPQIVYGKPPIKKSRDYKKC